MLSILLFPDPIFRFIKNEHQKVCRAIKWWMLCGKLWVKYEQARTHFRVLYTWDGNGWKNAVWAAVRLWGSDNMQPCKVGDRWYWRPDYPCWISKHANATIGMLFPNKAGQRVNKPCNLQKRTTTTLFLAGGWSRLLGHSCLGEIKEILVLNGNSKYEFLVQNFKERKSSLL